MGTWFDRHQRLGCAYSICTYMCVCYSFLACTHILSFPSPTQTGAAEEEEGEEEGSSSTEHPAHVAHGGLISPPVSTVAPKWSGAKPPSPPESKISVPQPVGRRSLPQHISPKADSPDQVGNLQLALETQAKVADVKKAHQEELDRFESVRAVLRMYVHTYVHIHLPYLQCTHII